MKNLVSTFSHDEKHALANLDSTYIDDYKERVLCRKIADSRKATAGFRRQLEGLHVHHAVTYRVEQLAKQTNVSQVSKQLETMRRKHKHLLESNADQYALKNAVAEITALFCELDAIERFSLPDFTRTLALHGIELQHVSTLGMHHDGSTVPKSYLV